MNEITPKARIIAAAAHVGFYLGGLGFLILPFLIKTVWNSDDFIVGHAKQALYMQIIALIVSILIIPMAFLISPEIATIGGIAFLSVAWGIFAIVGAYKAMTGEEYAYPVLKLVHLC